jgi:cytochrome c oxidase assembly protein subunit 15
MSRTAQDPWLHRYAIFVACSTFILIIAGALVTSNEAGLSVPDWPTSFGSFRMPPMVGGVLFEHGHRMIAGTVGILTILLAVGLWLKEARTWVRWVGAAAVLAVVAQALLGGITVLFHLPVAISASHATLGQIFFCLNSSIAMFTAATWRWDEPKLVDTSSPSLHHLTGVTTCAILVQLVLGSVYRHAGSGIAPHLVGACVVALLVVTVVARILADFPVQRALTRPALILAALLVVQVALGIYSYILKAAAQGQPHPPHAAVLVTTLHVAVGALTLVTSLYLTYQSHRFLLAQPGAEKIGSAPQSATI